MVQNATVARLSLPLRILLNLQINGATQHWLLVANRFANISSMNDGNFPLDGVICQFEALDGKD